MNHITEKSKIAKVTNTREGLIALREEIMKAEVSGKTVNTRTYTQVYKFSGSFTQFLIKLGAVEDIKPNAPKTDGKYLKWIYNRTENGVIDSWLVDKLIQAEKDAGKLYRDNKREQKLQIAPVVVEKKPLSSSICSWLEKELQKDELLDGTYLRTEASQKYKQIISTLQGLCELKAAIDKIKI